MKITQRQLRRIIKEVRGGWGEDDDTPENYEGFEDQRGLAASEYTSSSQKLKVGDLVRSIDFRGDGWGGDYEKTVGDEVGTVMEIDNSEDGPIQYVVHWSTDEPTMVSADELELVSESIMKITKRQLRRIIKESLLKEGTLYVMHGDYGYIGLEDDAGEDYSIGTLVRDLIASGDTDFFNGPQGVDEKSLQQLQASIDKGLQGGVERWDSDVFGTYYNVDPDRVFRLWSRGKNLNIEEVEVLPSEREEYEDEDDGTNDFEEYYS